jgi:putative salt-induced outer membrane protein YdiY
MKKTFCVMTILTLGLLGQTALLAEEAPPPAWHGNISLGLTVTRGNSKTILLNGGFLAENLRKHDEFRLGGNVTYGEQEVAGENETTAQAAQAFADWKHLFTERFFSTLRIDGFHDAVADLKYRVIVGPAAGYYFIKNPRTRLSGEAGASHVTEKQGNDTDQYVTLRLSERGEHQMNDRWKVWEQIDFLPQIDDFAKFLVIAEIGTDVALNNKLSLRVVFQDKYNSEPAPGRDKNDMSLITSIAYKY